LSCDPNGI